MSEVNTIIARREDAIDSSVQAQTPADMPNVNVIAMHPAKIVLVRGLRVYLQTLLGLLTAAGVGADRGLLPNDFGQLLWASSGLALAPVVYTVLQNAIELLARLDESRPQLRG